jgi:hypothetical protein
MNSGKGKDARIGPGGEESVCYVRPPSSCSSCAELVVGQPIAEWEFMGGRCIPERGGRNQAPRIWYCSEVDGGEPPLNDEDPVEDTKGRRSSSRKECSTSLRRDLPFVFAFLYFPLFFPGHEHQRELQYLISELPHRGVG